MLSLSLLCAVKQSNFVSPPGLCLWASLKTAYGAGRGPHFSTRNIPEVVAFTHGGLESFRAFLEAALSKTLEDQKSVQWTFSTMHRHEVTTRKRMKIKLSSVGLETKQSTVLKGFRITLLRGRETRKAII